MYRNWSSIIKPHGCTVVPYTHKDTVCVCALNQLKCNPFGHCVNSYMIRSVLNWNESTRLIFYLNGLAYCACRLHLCSILLDERELNISTVWYRHTRMRDSFILKDKSKNNLCIEDVLRMFVPRRFFLFVLVFPISFSCVFCVKLRLTDYKFSIYIW